MVVYTVSMVVYRGTVVVYRGTVVVDRVSMSVYRGTVVVYGGNVVVSRNQVAISKLNCPSLRVGEMACFCLERFLSLFGVKMERLCEGSRVSLL